MNTDKKFLRGLFGIIGWILTMGWIVYGLIYHEWMLVIAVVSSGIGTAINLAIREINKP